MNDKKGMLTPPPQAELTPGTQVRPAGDEHDAVPRQLIAERMLISALREQDNAAASEQARMRAQFLSDASLRFGASLDQELTYDAIAGVALPGLDAWCIVDVVEVGGGLRRLAIVHPDEGKRELAATLAGVWKPTTNDPIGVPAIDRDRVPVFVAAGADAIATSAGPDPDTLRILHSLGAGALLVVPIIAHHILYGAITFIHRRGAAAYTPMDVQLGEALALRCAQALEAARLYAAARMARNDAEMARAESDAANKTKAHFLNTMSHELRTPLNAIGGYAQLLEMGLRGPVTGEQLADLGSIQRSQRHLLGLVDAVLNYAQIDAGHVAYVAADIKMAELISDVHSFVAPQMHASAIHYSVEHVDPLLTACGDAEKVRQILLNLLGNAIKFTPQGGHVNITCAKLDGAGTAIGQRPPSLVVRVADSGVGIPADKLESVFEPFVQVDRGLTRAGAGVGLGLAISRELARGMRGDLTVETSSGAGSVFSLTLPIGPPDGGGTPR
ncbi:MAG: ATP-binding protein [bacterium]